MRYYRALSSPENKLAIEEYINTQSNSLQKNETVPVILKGKRIALEVFQIPLEYLYYNIKNGRFKAEYLELVRKNGGRELDPIDSKDATKIQNLLLELDPIETRRTAEDIEQRGQWNPGIMTHDGFVIDGNRRLSILQTLVKKDKKFSSMKLARLPADVDKNDLWKLEAGIQLGKDEIVRYGPVNELLKLEEGINAGLSTQEIAHSLYGYDDDKEIKKKLARLVLIKKFLEFNGTPEKYTMVKNKVEHFINTQNILVFIKPFTDNDPELKSRIQRALFGLIQDGTSHLEIRKIREMFRLNSEKALAYLNEIAELSKPKKPETKIQPMTEQEIKERLDDEVTKVIDPPDDEDLDKTSTTQISTKWTRAIEALNVTKNINDLPRLLGNAKENLDGIDYSNEQLRTQQCKVIIKQILRHGEKLRKILEE